MYDGLAIVSDNFALLAHAELMKSWDAPKSNKMMIGHPNSKNVPICTFLPQEYLRPWCGWHDRFSVLGS
jgi:hypothetical protein